MPASNSASEMKTNLASKHGDVPAQYSADDLSRFQGKGKYWTNRRDGRALMLAEPVHKMINVASREYVAFQIQISRKYFFFPYWFRARNPPAVELEEAIFVGNSA